MSVSQGARSPPRCPQRDVASKQTIHAAVQFTDIGGLVEGASQGEGSATPSSATFARSMRSCSSSGVRRRRRPGPQDPLEHLRVVEIELALADLASAEKAGQDPAHAQGRRLAEAHGRPARQGCRHVGGGDALYRAGLDDDARSDLKEFFFLTNKPVMAVLNIGRIRSATKQRSLLPCARNSLVLRSCRCRCNSKPKLR